MPLKLKSLWMCGMSLLSGLAVPGFSQADIVKPTVDAEWQQGAVLRGQLPKGEVLYFLDRKVPVSDDGHFVLGLDRDFPKTASLKMVDETGTSVVFTYPVMQRQYDIQKVEGVPAKTVNPDPKDLERIRNESAQVEAARKEISSRQDYRQAFQWPVLGRISGVYGSQRYYNGEAGRPHYGVDVARPTGTPIAAPIDGVVRLAHNDMFFSGGTLIVDHGQGLSSTFMHLSKILVEVGQEVKQGQLIAEVGSTGRATGPHLDWRMNWFDQRVDPELLVSPMAEAQKQSKKADADRSVE